MSGSGLSPRHEDDNRGGGIIATVVVLTVLASVIVALRIATRTWIVRSIGWDDHIIILAAFGEIIGAGLVIVEVHYGCGRHKDDHTPWRYIEFMKYSYGEWIQTFQTLMFTKISICLFLLRIPLEKYLIRPIQGAIIVLVVSNIALTLLWIFQCNPIASAWNKQTSGSCFTDGQLQRIIISQALISIISDFMHALFPIILLWKVQIALRIKAGLCTLMSLGLITAACCVVRTILNWQNVNSDPTWESIDNWYWRAWEVCIGVTAACIPTLRPGYKTVSSGITSYISHRFPRKRSDITLIDSGNTSQNPVDDSALRGAAQEVSAEADRAKEYGAGEDGFAMKYLPGDKKTANQGIKKTTSIDIARTSANESQRSLNLGDVERGFGNRDFSKGQLGTSKLLISRDRMDQI